MSLSIEEAQEYVRTIMSSQPVPVNTSSTDCGRKRHLSDPSSGLGSVKKARNVENGAKVSGSKPERVNTRRSLCKSPTSNSSKENESIEQLILKLSADVHAMHQTLSERIDKLESGLEQKISNKVSQMLDKRVNTEMGRIRKDVESQLSEIRTNIQAEVSAELESINDKISNLDAVTNENNDNSEIKCNIVIRNLPESANENTLQKVNSLIREGLKLREVTVMSADRKTSKDDNKAGVIVAKCRSDEDKSQIFSRKQNLKSSRQYSNVYIEHDQPRSERLMASNFRAILTAIKRRDTSVRMHGSRVVVHNSVDNTRTWGNGNDRNDNQHNNRANSQSRTNNGNGYNRNNDNNQFNQRRGNRRGGPRGGGRGRGRH